MRDYLVSMIELEPSSVAVVIDDVAPPASMTGVEHLTGATVGVAPVPCRDCMWWQTRPGRRPGDRRAMDAGARGRVRAVGQAVRRRRPRDRPDPVRPQPTGSPAPAHLPAGPPGRDAVLVTCAYLTDAHSPWVLQSLFLAAIGECRDRGLPALEAFGYRYPPDEGFAARFLGHRTIFPADFLRDFGFHPQRSAGRIELERLDLRAIEPAPEESRAGRGCEPAGRGASAAPAGVR